MALVALPPELRTLCRRLTASRPESLLPVLPVLLKDVLRCEVPLCKAQEAKGVDSTPEASALVHKLKTQITTLLQGRSAAGRFVGVTLAKAVIEAGGWECLRTSEPWVRSLLSILQKKDPTVTKEAALVTLVKIFTLIHGFPTLIREIVTPTLPTLATSCLQILKPPPSSQAPVAPLGLVRTIFESFSTLLPLYPTTLRQFAGKFKHDARAFVAPTSSDEVLVPSSLCTSSRRLVARLHMTAAKGGESSEWNRHIVQLIKESHYTADQVFRAIMETWESSSGYVPERPDLEQEPSGGSDKPDELPSWTGLQAGSERIIGLLGYIAEVLRNHTKSAVAIPISSLMDIITRISSIVPPTASKERFESAQMNPAIGREERDELWTALPGIQIAAMELLLTCVKRLGRNFVPLAQESLEHTQRMLGSFYRIPEVRHVAYILMRELLDLCGPTMGKVSVDSLELAIKCCCRDLLGASGHLKRTQQQTTTLQNGTKTKTANQNADAFLSGKSAESTIPVSLSDDHISSAEVLLTALHTSLPQQHVQSSARGRMLQSAILARSRDAQLASVLHPLRDSNGRSQVILPYLMRQFPYDSGVELLRFNFRPSSTGRSGDFRDFDDDISMADEDEEKPRKNETSFGGQSMEPFTVSSTESVSQAANNAVLVNPVSTTVEAVTENPFLIEETTRTTTSIVPDIQNISALKRKSEAEDSSPPKRVEIESVAFSAVADYAESEQAGSKAKAQLVASAEPAEDDDSDDESVHLDMALGSDASDGEDAAEE